MKKLKPRQVKYIIQDKELANGRVNLYGLKMWVEKKVPAKESDPASDIEDKT